MNRQKEENQFKKECKVIRLKYEYPGYSGDVPWLVISNLTVDEIHRKYENEIKPYSPFIYMSGDLFVPIRKSRSNNRKHEMRAARLSDAYGYVDGVFEAFHPELVCDPFAQPDWCFLYDAIESLPDNLNRRIYKKYFLDMKGTEIAAQEGVSQQAVSQSINKALRLMRENLSTPLP